MAHTGCYVLEVVKFIIKKEGPNGWLANGKFEHIGYMQAKFRTKEDACSYYDRHNPHMRKLNAFGTYKSDWDPKTKLLYIVRKDYGLNDIIPTFSKEDLPNTIYQNDCVTNGYKYLR